MSKGTCFIIAPIGEPESDTRRRSDKLLKYIFRPAASECGYEAVRADDISEPGIITSQVIQHIVEDPMVIADLSGWNPNVFYELAIRHALKKPLVQIISRHEKVPFDIAMTRTIFIDIQDLDSVEEAKVKMVAQMKAVKEETGEVDSPISVALDLQILRESGRPEDRSLADVMDGLSDLRKSIAGLYDRVAWGGDSGALLSSKNECKKLQTELMRAKLLGEKLNSIPRSWTPESMDADDMVMFKKVLGELLGALDVLPF